jgi:hypothetical protein
LDRLCLSILAEARKSFLGGQRAWEKAEIGKAESRNPNPKSETNGKLNGRKRRKRRRQRTGQEGEVSDEVLDKVSDKVSDKVFDKVSDKVSEVEGDIFLRGNKVCVGDQKL